jgi:uncharacterized membrane protein HdeD (DUF308 family)
MFGIQAASRVGIIFGVATIIFGILALVAPQIAGLSITVIVAVMLVAAGIARLLFAFRAESFVRGVLVFLFGGLSIVAGGFMFAQPVLGLSAITVMLGVFFGVDGVVEIVAAFKARGKGGWGWALLSGLASVGLAVLIVATWPQSTAWAAGTLVGVRLLFAGWSMVFAGTVSDAFAQQVIDDESRT